MKTIFLLLSLFSTVAFANDSSYSIRCIASDNSTSNRFEGVASISVDAANHAKSSLDFTIIPTGGYEHSNLPAAALNGSLTVFAPGDFAINEVFDFQLTDKNAAISYASLLVNYKAPNSSRLVVNGAMYLAQCSLE